MKRIQALLTLPPETAGEIIVKGVERRSPRILVGSDAEKISLIQRIWPQSYLAIVNRRLGL
jgi:hypothetical protein